MGPYFISYSATSIASFEAANAGIKIKDQIPNESEAWVAAFDMLDRDSSLHVAIGSVSPGRLLRNSAEVASKWALQRTRPSAPVNIDC